MASRIISLSNHRIGQVQHVAQPAELLIKAIKQISETAPAYNPECPACNDTHFVEVQTPDGLRTRRCKCYKLQAKKTPATGQNIQAGEKVF
jgi:hypothetical protein